MVNLSRFFVELVVNELVRIYLKLLFVKTSLRCSKRSLFFCVVRSGGQIFSNQVLGVVGALVKLAFTTDADMIADHIAWHMVRLHGSCDGRVSLLLLHDYSSLLYLHVLVYGSLSRLHLVSVILNCHGLASIIKHHCGLVLDCQTLHHALLIVLLLHLLHFLLLLNGDRSHIVFFGASERAM